MVTTENGSNEILTLDRPSITGRDHANGRACWCERTGFCNLENIEPIHVADYIEQHSGSAATIKQHMAAIRVMFSWLTEKGVLDINPARVARSAAEASLVSWLRRTKRLS